MSAWWRALVVCCGLVNCLEASDASFALLKNKYNTSFNLTRSTRTGVRHLVAKYKEQELGDKDFEDRSRQLKDLPVLSTDFCDWLKLTDMDRLQSVLGDMQAYSNKLEWKRKQLEEEEKMQLEVPAGKRSLPQRIWNVQLDLRDLMGQVMSQISYLKNSGVKPTSATTRRPLNPESGSITLWDSRVQGYIILRDLDLYLTKMARDFLLLGSKTPLCECV
ncbi:uncharacterized protein LOC114475241 [Gouania willdenowi]|uniref:uncharacterized protein LOC114475241 n=1 Tax=Gouania willdenowi TaxID=441366 RepID=UPI00105497DF|nr:uncharacterized protein LOC114475241 [Gouania willdenowi]